MKKKIICKRCVYDNFNIKIISFDDEGICNYCRQIDKMKEKYKTGLHEGEKAFEKIVEENPSINSIICLTTYENTYYQLSDGRVLILQASIDGEVIHQNERASDTFSLFIMGLGAIISVIYLLF